MKLSEEVLARAHAAMVGHVTNANPDRLVVFPTMKEEVRWSTDLTLDDFWPDSVPAEVSKS